MFKNNATFKKANKIGGYLYISTVYWGLLTALINFF